MHLCAAQAAVRFYSRAMKQHVETNCFMLQLGSPSMERLHNSSELECSEAWGIQHVNNMFCWPAASVSPACILSCERGGNACLQCHPAIFPEADAFATKRRYLAQACRISVIHINRQWLPMRPDLPISETRVAKSIHCCVPEGTIVHLRTKFLAWLL